MICGQGPEQFGEAPCNCRPSSSYSALHPFSVSQQPPALPLHPPLSMHFRPLALDEERGDQAWMMG
eukprot:6749475-Pyramimonas_sp.AAC.1